MPKTSNAHAGAVDASCASARAILRAEAAHYLGLAADDASEAARRLRCFTVERIEHGIAAGDWLSAPQFDCLRRLATVADLVAAQSRAILQEIG